jgi:hypothetical protein
MSYRNYGYDEDELVGAFSSMSVKKGRGSTVGKASAGAKFPEYAEELQKRPLSSGRRTAPPPCGPCAVVSNQAVRRRLGVEGDPSVDIDHIYEKHRAEVRGQYADIEVRNAWDVVCLPRSCQLKPYMMSWTHAMCQTQYQTKFHKACETGLLSAMMQC